MQNEEFEYDDELKELEKKYRKSLVDIINKYDNSDSCELQKISNTGERCSECSYLQVSFCYQKLCEKYGGDLK
jgi:hypothetical protein